jgi:hypothetical protein
MGRLLVLGIGVFPDMRVSNYRGVYRLHPTDLESHPQHRTGDDELKQLLEWYSHEYITLGGVDPRDLPSLRELLHRVRHLTEIEFEIVEVTKGEQPPQIGTEFLGFDISAGLLCHDSFLPRFLVPDDYLLVPPDWEDPEAELYANLPHYSLGSAARWDDPDHRIYPLYYLVAEHFGPKLNANWLFTDYATAKFCFDVITALRDFAPDEFEVGVNKFEVICGIYKVLVEERGVSNG